MKMYTEDMHETYYSILACRNEGYSVSLLLDIIATNWR